VLEPGDVSVQAYYGRIDAKGNIVEGQEIEMQVAASRGEGVYGFEGAIPCTSSGLYGYSVRVLPHHEHVDNPFVMNLITWPR
jgi:starch phosphorylase